MKSFDDPTRAAWEAPIENLTVWERVKYWGESKVAALRDSVENAVTRVLQGPQALRERVGYVQRRVAAVVDKYNHKASERGGLGEGSAALGGEMYVSENTPMSAVQLADPAGDGPKSGEDEFGYDPNAAYLAGLGAPNEAEDDGPVTGTGVGPEMGKSMMGGAAPMGGDAPMSGESPATAGVGFAPLGLEAAAGGSGANAAEGGQAVGMKGGI